MILVSLLPGVLAYGAVVLTWLALGVAALPLVPFVLLCVFISSVFVLRVVVPRPKPGTYSRTPFSLRWQLALEASAAKVGLFYLVRSFYTTRFLYMRALGATVAFNANNALDAEMSGVSLLTLGEGSIVALFSSVRTYRIEASGCTIAPVSIGAWAFVGNSARVGPGCSLGSHAFLGVMNELNDGESLADGERIADYVRAK